MKRSEMNGHQKMVFDIVVEEYNSYIGGLENGAMDGDEEAVEALKEHDNLKEVIYKEVMFRCSKGSSATAARFAGKDFIMERIEKRLIRDGH